MNFPTSFPSKVFEVSENLNSTIRVGSVNEVNVCPPPNVPSTGFVLLGEVTDDYDSLGNRGQVLLYQDKKPLRSFEHVDHLKQIGPTPFEIGPIEHSRR